jgi:hypothetical protein
MAKLNKGPLNLKNAQIPPPEELHVGLVSFSFKYLELEHEKFTLPDTAQKLEYLARLFDRLKQISSMKCGEFREAGKALRSHAIRWDQTSEPNGYAHLPEQLQQCQPWQFSIAREELGRVHGLWVGTIFYPIWVDHDHRLYE